MAVDILLGAMWTLIVCIACGIVCFAVLKLPY
jgi:hypothetical protein